MARRLINESTLSAIGDALRNKTGKTELINPLDMPEVINNISGELPEEAYTISGNCSYKFAFGGWDWFIKNYGSSITTKNITIATAMFSNSDIENIPFEINFKDGGCDVNNMFTFSKIKSIPSIDFKQTNYKSCSAIFSNAYSEEIGIIKNLYPSDMSTMFSGCSHLKYLPEFENLNMDRYYTYANSNLSNIFQNCYSLRSIPEDLLNRLYAPLVTGYYYCIFSGLKNLYALDEIRGLSPRINRMSGDMFYGAFQGCHRLKNIIFDTQEDGSPYVVEWKSQTIDLSIKTIGATTDSPTGISYVSTQYNSGITEDKLVKDDATYAALKDDPDWFTTKEEYNRYNKTSAINTINSLPDTSAYLATAGGTNTIKFNGEAGSKTDGGAINTMSEEIIAQAAAKGWTVAFV